MDKCGERLMGNKMRQFGLIIFGAVAGVMLSLNFSAIANKETQEVAHPLPVEELRAFTEVFGRIKSDYVEPVEDKKLITEAINGMLTGLDPHSSYLDADAFKELQIGTQGEFGGLGIEVSMEDGFVKVISPIEDTPAFRAGIKTGDLIIKLDDTAVKGLSLTEAIKRMRGKPNTPITLTVLRIVVETAELKTEATASITIRWGAANSWWRRNFPLIRYHAHGLLDLRLITEIITPGRFHIVMQFIYERNAGWNIEFENVLFGKIVEVFDEGAQ